MLTDSLPEFAIQTLKSCHAHQYGTYPAKSNNLITAFIKEDNFLKKQNYFISSIIISELFKIRSSIWEGFHFLSATLSVRTTSQMSGDYVFLTEH